MCYSRNDKAKPLPVSDLPSEALAVAEKLTLGVATTKRQLESLELEQGVLMKMKIELEEQLPRRIADNQRRIDDLRMTLREVGAIRTESGQEEQQQQEQQQGEQQQQQQQQQHVQQPGLGDRLEHLQDQLLPEVPQHQQHQGVQKVSRPTKPD